MEDEPVRKPAPRWLEGDDKAAKNKRAKNNEERIAKAFGGRRLPRSGGRRWSSTDSTTDQGDVTSPDFLVEHKHTINESISLKKAWLAQVEAGAKRRAKDSALVITFETADKRDRTDYVLIPLSVFERLTTAAKSQLK